MKYLKIYNWPKDDINFKKRIDEFWLFKDDVCIFRSKTLNIDFHSLKKNKNWADELTEKEFNEILIGLI
jgi:hypothetical protein